MTKIKACVYQAGELMAPTEGDIAAAFTSVNASASLDVGYYHKVTIAGFGRTYAAAKGNVEKRLRDFYNIMNRVQGFSSLRIEKDEYGNVFGNIKIVYRIVYVIESVGAATQNSDSPYAGNQRGVRTLCTGR